MRVSREKAAENRERIIDAAGALFRAKGFGGIGVADIMKAADLTHGGFYGHFASKDDLVAQASRRIDGARRGELAKRRRGGARQALRGAARALPVAAPSRRARQGLRLRGAGHRCGAQRQDRAQGVRRRLGAADRHFARKAIPGKHRKAARRRKAVAAMATLVGALTLARAVDDTALSDEILEAAHRELAAARASDPCRRGLHFVL